MNWFHPHKRSFWQTVGKALHLTKPESTSQKIINTVLHLLLYLALILFGYLLGQINQVV